MNTFAIGNRSSIRGTRSPLTNEQIQQQAPSVFAVNAHHEVSDRYSFVATSDIVETLRGAGWAPVNVGEQVIRKQDRQGFQRHVIRYQRQGDLAKQAAVGDSIFELVCINSHDRSSGIQFFGGLFRWICSNGLCVADSTIGKISLRHSGVDTSALVKAALGIADQVPKVEAVIGDWRSHNLKPIEIEAFTKAAAVLRYGDEVPFAPKALNNVRRREDSGTDLWSTFNRVQENLVSGTKIGWSNQVRQTDAAGREKRRVKTVREVKGIDTNVKLNKALWTLAEALRNGGALEATATATEISE